MFSTMGPNVYRKLRERRGMSQEELGDAMGGTRHVVHNFEAGKTRPDAAQEKRMLEILRCSQLEFAELVCEELGGGLGTPVGLRDNHGGYEPTSLLNMGYRMLRQAAAIPAALVRALDDRMKEIRLQSLLFELHNAALRELIQACREAIERHEYEPRQAPPPREPN